MKKILFLISVLVMASCGAARQSAVNEEPVSVRIGSYNLWISTIGKGDNAWELRKSRLVQSIVEADMDIFGTQELDTRIQEELPVLLEKAGCRYGWYIFSPYSPDGIGNKAQGIMYKKDKFELLESHYWWISETPDVMSSGWDETRFKRGACCAIFKDKKSGKKFMIAHSHMPLGKEARKHGAEIINEYAKKHNPKNLPAFLLGDLNTRPTTPESDIFRTYWTDSFLTLPAEKRNGPAGTFNGAKPDKKIEDARRIDYVYYRGAGITPVSYTCKDTKYDGFYPSDHCAVYVDFLIK